MAGDLPDLVGFPVVSSLSFFKDCISYDLVFIVVERIGDVPRKVFAGIAYKAFCILRGIQQFYSFFEDNIEGLLTLVFPRYMNRLMNRA